MKCGKKIIIRTSQVPNCCFMLGTNIFDPVSSTMTGPCLSAMWRRQLVLWHWLTLWGGLDPPDPLLLHPWTCQHILKIMWAPKNSISNIDGNVYIYPSRYLYMKKELNKLLVVLVKLFIFTYQYKVTEYYLCKTARMNRRA